MSKLKIEYKDISELIPYINNPRINDGAVDKVASSIKNFGFKNPIIIDKDNEIIAGHTRLKAARKLGLEEVPTIKVEDLTDNQIKAFRIADNKTAEFAEWDMELLEIEMEDLGDMFTGFSDDELDDIMGIDKEVEEDDFDEEPPDEAISKRGDIWQLGRHRLLCGDSTSEKDMEKLMNGALADLTVTDPPYNVDYSAKNEYLNKVDKGNRVQIAIENDAKSESEFIDFLEKAFYNMKSALKPGGVFYIWHAKRLAFSKALERVGLEERQDLIWIKNNMVIGRQDYQWKHEACLYGWKEGAGHYFIDDFTNTTVIEDNPNINAMNKEELKEYAKELRKVIDAGSTIIREDKPSVSDLHPTMKPLKLIGFSIKNSSKKGEIVLDQFGGSGSTLMACEQLDRICYMMEFDPKYVDVIINRWEQYTGQKAVLISE